MARITSFTVDGLEVASDYLRDGTLTIDWQTTGRAVLECTLTDPDGLYIPTWGVQCLIAFDDVPVFRGILYGLQVGNIAGPGRGVQSVCTFVDLMAYLDVVRFNGTIPAGTLQAQLAHDVDGGPIANLAPHGITLSPFQEDGPDLPDQAFDFATIRQVIDAFSAQSVDWLPRIDADTAEFRMYQPGTLPSGLVIREDDGQYRSASWDLDGNVYRNEIWFRYGPAGMTLITETFQGDGSTTRWELGHRLVISGTGVTPAGYVTVTRLTVTSNEGIDAVPLGGTAQWHYDVATGDDNAIEQDASQPVLLTGETVSITYYMVGPGNLFLRDDEEYELRGPWTEVVVAPDIVDRTVAEATLEAELRRRIGLGRRLRLITDQPGAQPLMTIEDVSLPSLQYEGDILITEVSLLEEAVHADGERDFVFELICVEGNRYRENWRAFWTPAPRNVTGPGLAPLPAPQPEVLFPTPLAWVGEHNTADTTSHDITLPTGINEGEFLLVVFSVDGAPTVTVDTGFSGVNWQKLGQTSQATNVTGAIFWKWAEGGSADVLRLTTDSSQQSSHLSGRIINAHGTSPISGAATTDNGSNPNPPSHTPSGGEQRYLWIATRHGDSNVNNATASPADYDAFEQEVGTNNGATTALATRQRQASSENPGAWTSDLAFSVVYTLAIRASVDL